jgi:hypothetical protein
MKRTTLIVVLVRVGCCPAPFSFWNLLRITSARSCISCTIVSLSLNSHLGEKKKKKKKKDLSPRPAFLLEPLTYHQASYGPTGACIFGTGLFGTPLPPLPPPISFLSPQYMSMAHQASCGAGLPCALSAMGCLAYGLPPVINCSNFPSGMVKIAFVKVFPMSPVCISVLKKNRREEEKRKEKRKKKKKGRVR